MLKKTILLGLIPTVISIVSCQNSSQQTGENGKDSLNQSTIDSSSAPLINNQSAKFDPSTLPQATAEMGQFPYFSVPDWVNGPSSYGFDRESDFGKIEFFTGSSFFPLEGKVFVKGYGMSDPKDAGKGAWDEYKFVQSFSKHFESLGAKKLYEGQIPKEQVDALNQSKNKDNYFYDFGTSNMENIVTYGLQTEGKTVLFCIASNSAYGALYVGEAAAFQQTVGIIKAEQIEKDLNEKGKSILHINFDTDKATLKPDGQEVVAEIAKVLKNNSGLKLDINGYTDNVGQADHNLKLSKDRANTVLNSLTVAGIDKSRLAANGFGANNFIADNQSEAGKEQNRRVELIKK